MVECFFGFISVLGGSVSVSRLRHVCTNRPGAGKLTTLLRSSSIEAVFLKKLRTSTTTLFISSFLERGGRAFMFMLNSLRRTNCFCRSLARIGNSRRVLFFPSSCHQTIGCKRGSTTGRVLHARILDHLRGNSPLYIIACPRTLTRGIMSRRMLVSGALGLNINRRISARFVARILTNCKFRRISCICRPKRCTMHNDVVSIFSFTSRCPCHVSFFNSRMSDVHAFRIRGRLSGRGGRDVTVIPRLAGTTSGDKISFFRFVPQRAILTVGSFL